MAKAGSTKTVSREAVKAVKPEAPVEKAASAEKAVSAVKAIAAKAPRKPVKKAEKPDVKLDPKADVAADTKPAAKPATETKEKARKAKLVRDSFTMPEAEYAVLGEMKKACLKAGIEVKKSELLRVGVALIRQLDTARLKEILTGLPALKAGRPKKTK